MSAHEFVRQHVGYPYCQICCHAEADHPTPAYVPQVGDRVRVVIEGVVRPDVTGKCALIVADDGAVFAVPRAGRIFQRLPDPLPTTPGSVVRDTLGKLHTLDDSGMWVNLDDYDSASTVEGACTVLFDAGATP